MELVYREPPELLTALNYELRIPLNSILGFVTLLRDHTLNENDRDHFMDRIVANSDHLLQILDEAFTLSKIDQGAISLEKVFFNASDMVYDVAQNLKSAAEKKYLGIHITFRNPIPRTVCTDPLKVRQILTHVLGNAISAAEGDGFILILLSFDDSAVGEPLFIIEIDDSGAGMARDDSFADPLWEEEKTDSAGFALARKFSLALGGKLEVLNSDYGWGRKTIFSFPVGERTDLEFLNKKQSPSFSEKIISSFKKSDRLQCAKILLAEDSEDNATVIRLYLSKEGASLTYVRNGLEAIEAVRLHNFDLILMDIEMPLLDGLEATRQIRQMGFRKPIIALTGYALRDDAEKSLRAGCDTHISKPVKKESLILEIQSRLTQFRAPKSKLKTTSSHRWPD